jgi:truncated hemoglobin YjbI
MVMMLPREDRVAHFHWASTNKQQPCFCKSTIDLDVLKLNATPETIASIFGIQHPQSIRIHDRATDKLIQLSTEKDKDSGALCWRVEPKQDYEVSVLVSDDDNDIPVVPINSIFRLFPGKDDDEKSERIEKLSNNFYHKLWDDETTPADLRKLFFSRTSSYKIQAFRQYDWFHETFGGPSMMDNDEREKHLLPKVMAKHTSSRMSKENAIAWLEIMNRSVEEEFPEEYKLRSALALYW